MAKNFKKVRKSLLSRKLNESSSEKISAESLAVITSVLEGVDLNTAFKREPSAAHPHSYDWDFKTTPVVEDLDYAEIGNVFGYIEKNISNLDFAVYDGAGKKLPKWRVVHQLAHEEVGPPTDKSPKSLVTWEWEVLKSQRLIEKDLGIVLSEEIAIKDSNCVMQDVVYRALTGKIPESHKFGFTPFDTLVPLEYCLELVEELD